MLLQFGAGLSLVVSCWLTMRKVVSSTPVHGNLHSAGLAHKYACNYVVFVSFRNALLNFMKRRYINVFD